jgi:hypothetical protein
MQIFWATLLLRNSKNGYIGAGARANSCGRKGNQKMAVWRAKNGEWFYYSLYYYCSLRGAIKL